MTPSVAGWYHTLHDVTVALGQALTEQGLLRSQEMLQRREVAQASQSSSVSGIELDERIATTDLRAELARLGAEVARLQLVHDTVTLFVTSRIPYNSDIDPWLSLTTSKR